MRLRTEISDMKTFIALFTSLKSKSCYMMFGPNSLRNIVSMNINTGQLINASDGGIWTTALKDNIFSKYRVESNTENTIVLHLQDVGYMIQALRTVDRTCVPGTVMMKLSSKTAVGGDGSGAQESGEYLTLGGPVQQGGSSALSDQTYSIPVKVLSRDDIKHCNPPNIQPHNFVCVDTAKLGAEIAAILERFRSSKVDAVTVEYSHIVVNGQPPQQQQQQMLQQQTGTGKLSLIGSSGSLKMAMSINNVPLDVRQMVDTIKNSRKMAAARRRARNEDGGGNNNDDDDEVIDVSALCPPDAVFSVTVSIKRLLSLMGIKENTDERGGMVLFDAKGINLWSNNGKMYLIGIVAARIDGVDD